MSNRTLIGLTGQAGAGKDTVRGLLESRHGFLGLAFADPVRDMVLALLDHVYARGHGMDRALKEKPVPVIGASYRELAQTLGTEWGRQTIHPGLWIDIAMHKVRLLWSRGERRIVISDVRFPDEMAALRAAGGEIWAITRPGIEPVREHVSEHLAREAVHFADRIINNDGNLDDLARAVGAALGGTDAKK
jgi:hypothetical protein